MVPQLNLQIRNKSANPQFFMVPQLNPQVRNFFMVPQLNPQVRNVQKDILY
jgi:hypothetical protein